MVHYEGPVYIAATLIFSFFATIVNNIEITVRVAAGIMAIASAIMAMRYYHYATKEKKETLKKLKSNP